MTILELAQLAGINPKWVASTGGGEYHSACPTCGGANRFRIQPNWQNSNCLGSYCCRKCDRKGDAIQFARDFLNYTFDEATDALNTVIPNKGKSSIFKKSHTPEMVTLAEPPTLWKAKSTELIEQAHKQLLLMPDALASLAARGIPIDIVQQYKFGWSTVDQFLVRSDWGLQDALKEDGNPSKLWIPKGLVIPINKPTGQVIRLKVRRQDWKNGDELPKYVVISGSMNGLSRIGSSTHNVMIVVESELDAYAVDHAASDFAFVVAVGSNIKNPDNVTDRLAKNVATLLICYDNDNAGKAMLTKWRSLYPHARGYPTPLGKDIGEAIQQEFNIRQWLLQAVEYQKTGSSL